MSLLEITDLAVRFRVPGGRLRAVDGISFAVGSGEAVGLVGESGCGKTTVARAILGRLPANGRIVGGSIRLAGEELVGMPESQLRRHRWRDMSLVFQGAMNALNPVSTVRDQIAEPITERMGLDKATARARAHELLELVGIPKKRATAYPHELSGGMRQRAMIAMALACDPAIVIGDEPTTALDVMVQAQILELLERLRRDLGLSLILCVMIGQCFHLPMVTVFKDITQGTRAFTLSLPITPAEYAAGKLLANGLLFLAPAAALMVAVCVTPPDHRLFAAPLVLLMLLGWLIFFMQNLGVAMVTESTGAMIVTLLAEMFVVGNGSMMVAPRIPGARHLWARLEAGGPVRDMAFGVLGLELFAIVALILFLMSRKRRFV